MLRTAPVLVVVALTLTGCGDAPSSSRQELVAERGAEVMPFDLDLTMHRFEPTLDGLVQSVVATDPSDAEQIDLIRRHLAEEAERFATGDFGDPAHIHGADMPGLAVLERAHAALDVELVTLPDGAMLRFSTDDSALVDALHRWGAAQVADHGVHAEHHRHG